jgi:plasmid stability protein
MKPLVVSEVEEDLVSALERRAVRNGRSIEAEHRQILREALRREARTPHDAIDALYDELARQVALRRPGSEDAALEDQIAEILDRLHRSQEEAQALRQRSS